MNVLSATELTVKVDFMLREFHFETKCTFLEPLQEQKFLLSK